eukprot:4319865-Amphidinium_carterae.2
MNLLTLLECFPAAASSVTTRRVIVTEAALLHTAEPAAARADASARAAQCEPSPGRLVSHDPQAQAPPIEWQAAWMLFIRDAYGRCPQTTWERLH